MTQKRWIHPSPLLHRECCFGTSMVVLRVPNRSGSSCPALVVIKAGRFLQGKVNLSWYQGEFLLGGTPGTVSHRTAQQTIASIPGLSTFWGWQVHLSSRGQQDFREGTCTVNLEPLQELG